MKEAAGIWLPDSDTHMAEWLEKSKPVAGRGTYQYRKLEAAHRLTRRHRTAVDVGAHVGTWSRILAGLYDRVHAFEPIPEHAACWRRNMEGVPNAVLTECGLGAFDHAVTMAHTTTNTGECWVVPASSGALPIRRMDDMGLVDVDLLKIDCEGYEPFVVEGGMETIRRDLPVIIVEQEAASAPRYGLRDREAVTMLEGMGYRVVEQLTNDYILVHPESAHA